jgi:hypothetical protein
MSARKMKMGKRYLAAPRIHLCISPAAFNEIALLLCSTEYAYLCTPKEDEGVITKVYLPNLTLEAA